MQYLTSAGLVDYCPATHLHADLWSILVQIPISIMLE